MQENLDPNANPPEETDDEMGEWENRWQQEELSLEEAMLMQQEVQQILALQLEVGGQKEELWSERCACQPGKVGNGIRQRCLN